MFWRKPFYLHRQNGRKSNLLNKYVHSCVFHRRMFPQTFVFVSFQGPNTKNHFSLTSIRPNRGNLHARFQKERHLSLNTLIIKREQIKHSIREARCGLWKKAWNGENFHTRIVEAPPGSPEKQSPSFSNREDGPWPFCLIFNKQ